MPWGNNGQLAIFDIDTGVNIPAPVNDRGSYVARVKCVAASIAGSPLPAAGQYLGDIRAEATVVFGEPFYRLGAPFDAASDPKGRNFASRVYIRVRVSLFDMNDNVGEVRPEQFEWRLDRLT